MQSSLLTQSLHKPTQMPKFKIAVTEIRISFNLTWKMRTPGSILHPLWNTGNDQQYFDQKMKLLYPEEFLVEREMLKYTHEHSYLNSGTISLSALLQGKLYKNSLENSLSLRQRLMDQSNNLIMPREGISMCTT